MRPKLLVGRQLANVSLRRCLGIARTICFAIVLGACFSLTTNSGLRRSLCRGVQGGSEKKDGSSSSSRVDSGLTEISKRTWVADDAAIRTQRQVLSCLLRDVETPHNIENDEFFRDNLEEDLAPWSKHGFTVDDFKQLAANHPEDITLLMLQIKSNKLSFVRRAIVGNCGTPWIPGCLNPWMADIVGVLSGGMDSGEISLPDTVFILNVDDVGFCADPGFVPGVTIRGGGGEPFGLTNRKPCAAPMLALFKQNGERGLLVPEFQGGTLDANDADFFGMDPQALPWSEREPVAFFRGTLNCNAHYPHRLRGRDVECSRTSLRNVSMANIAESDIWSSRPEPGLIEEPHHAGANKALALPMDAWSRYRYIAHLDGTSGSHRLFKVMAQGSAVLKQDSRWLQWFYRSLQPCVHYVPFFHRAEDDIVSIVHELRKSGNDPLVQQIGVRGQLFARQWTTRSARLLYWKRAIERYTELFTDYHSIKDQNLTLTFQ